MSAQNKEDACAALLRSSALQRQAIITAHNSRLPTGCRHAPPVSCHAMYDSELRHSRADRDETGWAQAAAHTKLCPIQRPAGAAAAGFVLASLTAFWQLICAKRRNGTAKLPRDPSGPPQRRVLLPQLSSGGRHPAQGEEGD